jgi:hypothetical protein
MFLSRCENDISLSMPSAFRPTEESNQSPSAPVVV